MGLPYTLPGVRSNPLVRVRYRKKAQAAHGEDLLRVLAHVARNGFRQTVWQWEGRTAPVAGHSPHSMHYERYPDGIGKAFDTFGSSADMAAFAAWCDRYAPQLDELIHNPNASRKIGQRVPPGFWGSAVWAGHANHVHVGNDGPASKR